MCRRVQRTHVWEVDGLEVWSWPAPKSNPTRNEIMNEKSLKNCPVQRHTHIYWRRGEHAVLHTSTPSSELPRAIEVRLLRFSDALTVFTHIYGA